MPDRRNKTGDDVLIYTGGATTRQITEQEWLDAGVKDQGTVVFDKTNNWRMPVKDLTNQAVRLLLESHAGEFGANQVTIPAPNGE